MIQSYNVANDILFINMIGVSKTTIINSAVDASELQPNLEYMFMCKQSDKSKHISKKSSLLFDLIKMTL